MNPVTILTVLQVLAAILAGAPGDPVTSVAGEVWSAGLDVAGQAGGVALPARIWREPVGLVAAGEEPIRVYGRVGDRWPVFAVEPGGQVQQYAEYFDGETWWVFVTVRGTSLCGWTAWGPWEVLSQTTPQ